jgi:GNAT superfamily N-acetyltransferase
MESPFEIRNLARNEIQKVIDMAAAEGWNPGLEDAEAFFEADPDGFFVGELAGVPIAVISVVNYHDQYGFVGLYIVKEEYRGRGYGYRLWRHALDRVDTITAGLDGVPAQLENYEKSGFVYAFRQMRLAITAFKTPVAGNMQLFSPDKIEAITAYDTTAFGVERASFTKAWLTMSNAKTFYIENGQDITGYAVLRKCGDGYKIGPLFADNEAVAEQLFLACCNAAEPGNQVFIDMPEINSTTQRWIDRYNLKLVFETARMYKNGIPAFPLSKLFGVTTFELG